jgi:eukaryotic-like serine/threonine-protein kinase
MVGQQIGNYRAVRQLGRGGMGAIFEAVHQQIGRRAVVKVLHPEFSQDPQLVQRLFNEARAASVIEHPGVVEIFESGVMQDGTAYIIMEFLRGEVLGERLRRQPHPPLGDALRVGRQVASVLAAAHEKGIVHRDLKPDNVFLVPDPDAPGGERIKLLDFGIAKVKAEYQGPGQEVLTRTGTLMGTPEFMAPEQVMQAAKLDGQADVYALGVVLYLMLAGQLPFTGELTSVMMMHVHQPPPSLLELAPETPRALAGLVHAMLAKPPPERPTMRQVQHELEHVGALPREALLRFMSGPGRWLVAAAVSAVTALLIVTLHDCVAR